MSTTQLLLSSARSSVYSGQKHMASAMKLTASVGEKNLRKKRLVTSFSGRLTCFLPSPYPKSMISGVFSSTKVEFYSFTGNYFDTHNSFNSRVLSFHKLPHSHFIDSLPDDGPL